MLTHFLAVRCRWVGYVISAALSLIEQNKQNEEIEKQNRLAQEQAEKANRIEMEAYHRDRQMEERQQAFEENKEQYRRWENLINRSPQLKSRMIDIWSARAV